MRRIFVSLSNSNYRIWAIGALISNIGGWMQRTAQDWIVLTELTQHNATAVGIVMGLITAVVLVRLLNHYLAGFHADDPVLIGLAAALVATTSAAACAVPAWRATRMDPVVAIRQN